MKRCTLLAAFIACTLVCTLCCGSSEWTEYLGNSQRTGYSSCSGPDMPEVLWKVRIPGDIDTSLFIIEDKVLVLWKDAPPGHTLEAKVILLDVLTGNILLDMRSLLFSEVFPVGNQIIGRGGRGLYEIDVVSGKISSLVEIPEKPSGAHNRGDALSENEIGKVFCYTLNKYPIVLRDKIVVPITPATCLSNSDFGVIWNLEDTIPDLDVHPHNIAGDETIVVFLVKNGVPQLLAVDASTGMLEWMSDPLPWAFWLALGEDSIYCGGKHLWAFSKDGSTLWEFAPEEEIVSNIVLEPDAVYIADAAKNLYKIDLNGNLIWETVWEGSPFFQSHLIGAGDILFCIENLGDSEIETAGSQVTAYSMEDGSKMWSIQPEYLSWVRGSPAVAKGILVIGNVDGTIVALASDPDLFVKQGDAFLSEDLKEKAVNSYEKAAELYEKKGDLSRSQEVQERIQELENEIESIPPTTPPEPFIPQNLFAAVLLIAVLIGIIVYYRFTYKKSRND